MGLIRLAFNFGAGTTVIGWGETSLMMIAGGFVGWQPVVVAGLIGLIPGMIVATRQWTAGNRQQIAFSIWLAVAVVAVLLGWYWIGPLVQGLFFSETSLLLLVAVFATVLAVFSAGLRLAAISRPVPRP
jgi:hypothetical protein